MSLTPGPAGTPVFTALPVTKDVAGTRRLLVIDTCALLDLVRTEVVEGHVTALEQHEAAATLLRSSSEGVLAILAPSRVLLELGRLESDEIQRARDQLTGYVERQRRLFATLARFGLAEPPADVRIDRYLDTVSGMLGAWRQAVHELPQSEAAAAAALRRVDRGDLPARAVRDRPGERAQTRKIQLWDCVILETVFEALDALDLAGHAHEHRLFLSSDGQAFGTARQEGTPLRREFDKRGLRYVATFEEAVSVMS